LALSVPWLESHARDLSALHMNLAVCALFDNKPEPALEHYKNARQALENTVTHLKQQLEQEKANPTPVPVAAAAEPAAPAAAAAAAATPAASSAVAEAKPPQTQAEKLAAELSECVEILEELKERVSFTNSPILTQDQELVFIIIGLLFGAHSRSRRSLSVCLFASCFCIAQIDDITTQLSLPANEQALALVKQNLSSSSNPFGEPEGAPAAAAAANNNPFAAPANPFAIGGAAAAASSSASAAAAPAAAAVTQLVPKRKKPAAAAPATAAASATPAPAAASAADEPAAKRPKA
jgi:hypothetical protein